MNEKKKSRPKVTRASDVRRTIRFPKEDEARLQRCAEELRRTMPASAQLDAQGVVWEALRALESKLFPKPTPGDVP